jgi:hypothetical protein
VRRFRFLLVLIGAIQSVPAIFAADEKLSPQTGTPQLPSIRLAPQSSVNPPTALHYRLLPDSGDLTAGNAAPLWYQAALVQRSVTHKITEEEYKWAESSFALARLPRGVVKELLAPYGGTFQLARRASLRERCDWGQPPITWQNIGMLVPHIQSIREIALLLSIQCRLQLSERRFDEAADTLLLGFTLARHLGKGNTLIECLVGLATAGMMLARVEEWMQTPDSPNLYWPLSALPRPLVEIQTALEQELNIVYRSFPELRELHNTKLSPREVDAAFLKLFQSWNLLDNAPKRKDRPALKKLEMALVTAKMYPEARLLLIDRGWPVKTVDAMSMKQATLLVEIYEADRVREDIQKCLSLPSWQALPELARVEREARAAPEAEHNLFLLGMAAFSKVFAARVRVEHDVAALRCGEALRLYAAIHNGTPPAKWSDVVSVPLPVDPSTGEGFGAFYEIKQGRAILTVPEMPGQGIRTGRRIEWFRNN